jgi:hypothetical protein
MTHFDKNYIKNSTRNMSVSRMKAASCLIVAKVLVRKTEMFVVKYLLEADIIKTKTNLKFLS